MSTSLTQADYNNVSKDIKQEMDQRRRRSKLTRTTSIDKINAYICSQNYYVINAILFWLRTSQTILQRTIEAIIIHIKSFIYTTFDLKLFVVVLLKGRRIFLGNSPNFQIFERLKKRIFKVAVYTAMVLIFSQLFVILYCLISSSLPLGFIFLFTCIYLIIQVQMQILHFYWTLTPTKPSRINVRQSRIDTYTNNWKKAVIVKPKHILSGRTISNLQFF